MQDPNPTTADEIEVALACEFERGRRGGSLLRTAIRAFAGLPRLTGLDKARMRLEAVSKSTMLNYHVSLSGCYASGFLDVNAGRDQIEKEMARIAEKLEEGLRSSGVMAHPNRTDVDRPWAFKASPLLNAALRETGVDPAAYLAEIHRHTRWRPFPARTRHGAPIRSIKAKPFGGTGEDPRNDLPWDLPDHLVSMTGREVELHEIRLGPGAAWGKILHRGEEAALSVRGVLPQTVRMGAAGSPLNALVDDPLVAEVDTPVSRVLRNGGATVLLVAPSSRYMADPPPEIATRIARMREGLAAIAGRAGPAEQAEQLAFI